MFQWNSVTQSMCSKHDNSSFFKIYFWSDLKCVNCRQKMWCYLGVLYHYMLDCSQGLNLASVLLANQASILDFLVA